MQFFLLLPILFVVYPSLPIQEDVQNLLFPLAALAMGVWALLQGRRDGIAVSVPALVLGGGYIVWALLRMPSHWFNNSTNLLLLGSICVLLSVPNIRIRYMWQVLLVACLAIQGIAWLEVAGVRLYGNKPISLVTSVFNQKNHFQLFSIPMAWAASLYLWSQGKRFFASAIFTSALLLCVLAQSDAGLVSCLGAFAAVAWWRFVKPARWTWIPWIGILGFLFVPFWAYYMLPWVSGHSSILSRIAIWDSARNALKVSPIFGQGLGCFQSVIRDYTTKIPGLQEYMQNGLVGAAHNHYLHTVVELGLVGVVLELVFFIGATLNLYKWAKKKEGFEVLWMGIPVFVLLMISITIPSQVFFSARLGLWCFFAGFWLVGRDNGVSIRMQQIRWVLVILGGTLIVASWQSERRRLESMRIIASEVVNNRVDQDRLARIPQALEVDPRSPYALWFMAQGFYHNQMEPECLQVLQNLEEVSGQFFPARALRKKCEDLAQ